MYFVRYWGVRCVPLVFLFIKSHSFAPQTPYIPALLCDTFCSIGEIKYAIFLLNKNLFLQRSPFPFIVFSNSRFYNHILQVKQNPYLGILLSEDIKWESHLINTTKKANSTLAFLKRNLRYCPEACRRTAYIALVRSVLEYRSTVWDPYYVKDIDRLEKVQLPSGKIYIRRLRYTRTRMYLQNAQRPGTRITPG